MRALWDGHEFAGNDLGFWSQEIFASALELPESERAAFIGQCCEGSDDLRAQVEVLLANAWSKSQAPSFHGMCRPGEIICDCLILRPLGRGGMGEV